MEKEIFIKNTLYPNATDLFQCNLECIENIKGDCIFVIDTNVLLVPYTVRNISLKEIEKLYKKLIKENRLIIPGQVAREFVNRRPDHIKNLHKEIKNKIQAINNISKPLGTYPFLQFLEEYKEIIRIEKELDEKLKKYKNKFGELAETVKTWTWNDPVSIIYKSLFGKDGVVYDIDIEKEKNEILEVHRKRFLHTLPPGYKDGGKLDDGIGDFLIWMTILKIGEERQKNVIFLSGETKSDWWHRSDKELLYPRFELVHEFQCKSTKSFHIIKLSRLLELFGINAEIVKEIEKIERPTREETIPNSSINNNTVPDFSSNDVSSSQMGI